MRAYRLLRDQRITFFGGVPALWERIAQAPDFADADLSELRSAYTGGAPVPKPLLDVFRSKGRSEEHTSELQSLMRISYDVFRLTKKKHIQTTTNLLCMAHK